MQDRIVKAHQQAAKFLGLLSYAHALQLGFDKSALHRLVAAGKWERFFPRVFRLWLVDDEWRQRVVGTSLWAGDSGTISHRCAAAWWGFDACEPTSLEVTLKTGRKPPRGIIVHRVPVSPTDRARSGCISITTPGRTLLDLASQVDPTELESAVHSAVRDKKVSLARLRLVAERNNRRHGARPLLALIDDLERYGVTDSPLEVSFLQLLRRHRFPAPARQYRIKHQGDLIARVDFAYPAHKVAIEVDGLRFHSSRSELHRDHQRLNRLQLAGWIVLFVSLQDLHRPANILARLTELLGQQRFCV